MKKRKLECDNCKCLLSHKEWAKSLDNKDVEKGLGKNGKCKKCGKTSNESIIRTFEKEKQEYKPQQNL